jgi:hypothetical protein
VIHARIHQGRVEVQDPIPAEWEGQMVKILPTTPDDPIPGLEEWLAELHAMGPMEFDPGEHELMVKTWAELDAISKAAMQNIAGIQT